MFTNSPSTSDIHGQRKLEDFKGDPKILRDSPLFTHKYVFLSWATVNFRFLEEL